jgi:hypothetical protein
LSSDEVIFEWISHPIRQNPHKAIIFWLVAGLTLGLVYAASGQLGWVIIAILFLVGSLRAFLFPTCYRVTTSGIEIRQIICKVVKKCSDIKRADFMRNGIFLSPFAKSRRLENYRGLFLPYPDDRERLEKIIRERIPSESQNGID